MWWGGVSWVAGLGCRRFRCVLRLQVLHSILCHVFLDGQLVCMDQSAGHRLGCLMPDAFRRETTQWILLSNSNSAPKSSRDACGVAALMDLAAVCLLYRVPSQVGPWCAMWLHLWPARRITIFGASETQCCVLSSEQSPCCVLACRNTIWWCYMVGWYI